MNGKRTAVSVALGAGLLSLLVLSSALPTVAQPAFPGTDARPSVNLRVYPAQFWTPRVGPGLGVGLVAHNLARRHDQWLVAAAPARDEQVATASFASANPQRARRYVLVDVRALHTDADWLGPASRRTILERSALRARLRVGQSLLDRRLLVQPHLVGSYHHVDDVRPPTTGPPFFSFRNSAPSQTGVRAGVDLQFDTRDQSEIPTRGLLLQTSWDRYVSLDGTDLEFDQLDLDAYGYVPLGGVHRLATRASLTLTRPRGAASVPSYMQPTVGGSVVPGWARGRFVDRDRLLTSVLYRFPLVHYENLAIVEGHVGAHLAGAYDRFGDQFSPSISFEEDVVFGGASRPLRPSASAGLRFAMPRRPHAAVELALGVSPEGLAAVRFAFERSLRSLRPVLHRSATLR
jgi:hypothetical protein